MNQAAARLGMTQTSYVNPNGLPADEQITSARDHGDPCARDLPRVAGIRDVLAHLGDQIRQARHAQLQHAARPLSRHRRHEDRLHLRLRLQRRGVGEAQRPPADRGDARRAVRRRARRQGRADAGARIPDRQLSTGCTSAGTTVDQLQARSTRRRPICATRFAARSASVRPPNPKTSTTRSIPKPRCRPAWIRTRRRRSRCRACAPPTASRRRCSAPLTPSMEPIEVFLGAYKGAVPVQTARRAEEESQEEELSPRRRSLRQHRRSRVRPRGKASNATVIAPAPPPSHRLQAGGCRLRRRQHRSRPLQPASPCRRPRKPRRRNPRPAAHRPMPKPPPSRRRKPAAAAQPAAR